MPHLLWMQDGVQAKMMHISMCIKKTLLEESEETAWDIPFLELLSKVMWCCTVEPDSPYIWMAIHQALPSRSQHSILPYLNSPAYAVLNNLYQLCYTTSFACHFVQRIISLLAAAQCKHGSAKIVGPRT